MTASLIAIRVAMTDLFFGLDAMPEAESRLALWLVMNGSVPTYRALIEHFGSAAQALAADWRDCVSHDAHLKRLRDWHDSRGKLRPLFDRIIREVAAGQYQLIFEEDHQYPALLRQIADCPPFLFVRGNVACLNQPQLAIVGTRKPTPSGRQLAFQFAQTLAREGVWITSGLAHGIDGEAHAGALAAGGGRTVAVMATGIDQCYPQGHARLQQDILSAGGALVTEFVPGTPPLAYQFPRRNRLVSGMALGTLIVEGAIKSGSLITARLALEQNREVFALPGHLHNPQALGCLELIRTDGARLVYEPQHILDALNLLPSPLMTVSAPDTNTTGQTSASQGSTSQNSANLDSASQNNAHTAAPTQAAAHNPALTDQPVASNPDTGASAAQPVAPHLQKLWQALDWTPQDMDTLIDQTGLPVADLTAQLMELELAGMVISQNGRYQRCRS